MSRFTNAASPAALIISAMALTISLSAGGAYAATLIGTSQLKNSSVTSAKIKDKTITTKDLSTAAKKSLAAKTGPAGATGPAGTPGAPGAAGQDGADATALWAVVRSSGALRRSSSVVSSAPGTAGVYVVTFTRNVSGCSFIATVGGDTTASPGIGYATVRTSTTGQDAVAITTYNKDGVPTDRAFHIAVFC